MSGIAAKADIAPMENKQSIGDCAMRQNPRNAMGNFSAAIDAAFAIAVPHNSSLPQPAVSRFIYMAPETITQGLRGIGAFPGAEFAACPYRLGSIGGGETDAAQRADFAIVSSRHGELSFSMSEAVGFARQQPHLE